MLAFVAAFVVAAAAAGVLWIFVYGDGAWPESANTMVMVLAVAASALIFFALVAASYSFGKEREASGGLSRTHVFTALAVSVALPLLVLFHQWQVGNIGGDPGAVTGSSTPAPAAGAASDVRAP